MPRVLCAALRKAIGHTTDRSVGGKRPRDPPTPGGGGHRIALPGRRPARAQQLLVERLRLPDVYQDKPDTHGLGGLGGTRRTSEPVQDGLSGHSRTQRDGFGRLPKPRAQVRFLPGALAGCLVASVRLLGSTPMADAARRSARRSGVDGREREPRRAAVLRSTAPSAWSERNAITRPAA
jgi:hypothetical protein